MGPTTKTLKKPKPLFKFFGKDVIKSSINLNDNYFKIVQSDSIIGYAYLQQALSKHDKFDFLAIYSPNMKLKKLRILTYRENYGGEISNKRWLKQFLDREVNDVQAISGATISVESMKIAIASLTQKMKNWKTSQISL